MTKHNLEQAERAALSDELALSAQVLPALPPEVFEVELPDIAGPYPPGAGGLREYAGEVCLVRAGEPLWHHVLAARDEPADRELCHGHPVKPATCEEADGADVGLGIP